MFISTDNEWRAQERAAVSPSLRVASVRHGLSATLRYLPSQERARRKGSYSVSALFHGHSVNRKCCQVISDSGEILRSTVSDHMCVFLYWFLNKSDMIVWQSRHMLTQLILKLSNDYKANNNSLWEIYVDHLCRLIFFLQLDLALNLPVRYMKDSTKSIYLHLGPYHSIPGQDNFLPILVIAYLFSIQILYLPFCPLKHAAIYFFFIYELS